MKRKRTNVKRRKSSLREKLKALASELEFQKNLVTSEERQTAYLQKALESLTAKIPPAFVWRCADGRNVLPSEMDEQHLRNTISFLQRTLTHKWGTTPYLEYSAYSVTAMAEMLKEAKQRGYRV